MTAAHAIDARIRAHQGALLAFLMRRAPDEAEELAQEVWIRMADRAPAGLDDSAFRAYAFAVARRLLIDRSRRRAARIRLVPWPDDRPDLHPSREPVHHLTADAMAEVVQRTVDAMPSATAEVFHWRVRDDVPFREIAARQGVSINTALGRMHQATKKIRTALQAEGLWPDGGRP